MLVSHRNISVGAQESHPLTHLTLLSLVKRAVERVVEDIAQREQAYQVAALIDHNETVHA
jgi:RecG-like helicase